MNYIISGRNIDVTPALKEDIIRKAKKIERFFTNTDTDIHITMRVQRFRHIANATVKYCGHVIKVEKHTEDMYASIDEVIDTLEENIKKLHSKRTNNGKRHISKLEISHVKVDDDDNQDDDIITITRTTLKLMDIDEAIKQLELHHYQFFMFLNSDTKTVNTVYRKIMGGYCVIQPDI